MVIYSFPTQSSTASVSAAYTVHNKCSTTFTITCRISFLMKTFFLPQLRRKVLYREAKFTMFWKPKWAADPEVTEMFRNISGVETCRVHFQNNLTLNTVLVENQYGAHSLMQKYILYIYTHLAWSSCSSALSTNTVHPYWSQPSWCEHILYSQIPKKSPGRSGLCLAYFSEL